MVLKIPGTGAVDAHQAGKGYKTTSQESGHPPPEDCALAQVG